MLTNNTQKKWFLVDSVRFSVAVVTVAVVAVVVVSRFTGWPCVFHGVGIPYHCHGKLLSLTTLECALSSYVLPV